MTPGELADRHPRLYHLTRPGVAASVRRHGLLSAQAIVEREGGDPDLLTRRRPREAAVGDFVVNDNLPLSETALAKALDDGLTVPDWMAMLNAHVFFWVRERDLAKLLGARTNRDRARDVLVFDTRGLAAAHFERVKLSPINSGATSRSTARRGLSTYARAADFAYDEWRRLRGRATPDEVREVLVEGSVPDAGEHLVEVREIRP